MCRAGLKIAPKEAIVVLNNLYQKIIKTLGVKPGQNKIISSAEQFKSMESRLEELNEQTKSMQSEMTRALTRAFHLESDLSKERMANKELE
jgi:CII-binding regulator of phage lambda lysogenization HflD